MKILIIEDNESLNDAIFTSLSAENFVCEKAKNYNLASEKINLYEYDIVIVDINLPDGTGLDIIRELKKINPLTGIIVISARNSLNNKIEGIELGADDYLTKPFDMAELIVRIKSLVRRRFLKGENIITIGDVAINVDKREVKVKNNEIELTKSEYEILLFLFLNPNRVITKESIAEHIWGDNMDLADSFDFIYSHIKNLKKKIISQNANYPIKSIYGIGYKLDIDETD
ncbi:MAG: response regulator transcription factor [Bacteroidales bacterium]